MADHQHQWETLSIDSFKKTQYCSCGVKQEVELDQEDLDQLGLSEPGVVEEVISNVSMAATSGREQTRKDGGANVAP